MKVNTKKERALQDVSAMQKLVNQVSVNEADGRIVLPTVRDIIVYNHHPNKANEPLKFYHYVSVDPFYYQNFGRIRDKNTKGQAFCDAVDYVMGQMADQFLKTFLRPTQIHTGNFDKATVPRFPETALISVERGGRPWVEIFRDRSRLGKDTPIGTLLIQRVEDEHHQKHAKLIYQNLPPITSNTWCLIPDAMLASGMSLIKAEKTLVEAGADPKKIISLHLVSTPMGVAAVNKACPHMKIFVAAMDAKLNKLLYICGDGLLLAILLGRGGIGDFSKRYFGTVS